MEQTHFILKEYFLYNNYPFDLLNKIIVLYHQIDSLEIHVAYYNTLLKTKSNDVYHWSPTVMKEIQLPSIKKTFNHCNSMYVITWNNDLYAWGNNVGSQLGLDTTYAYIDNPTKVNLPNIIDIVCGHMNVLALTSNGDIYTWGNTKKYIDNSTNLPEKVELSNVKKIYCGDTIKFAITESNDLYTWKFKSPQKIMSRVKIMLDLSFIITLNNELYALGDNKYGQLGVGRPGIVLIPQKVMSDVRKVICQAYLTIAITLTNEVYYWGYRDSFPVKMNISNVKDIFCGKDHIVALTYDNNIYGWGNNGYGQLGNHEIRRYDTPIKIELDNVREVICKANYTFAITHTSKLYAFGQNDSLQLGLNKERSIFTPTKVQIENIKQVLCPFEYLTIIITWTDEIYYSGTWRAMKTHIPLRIFPF